MVRMENRNRALLVASGWLNEKQPYETYHFTHVFLWRGNRDAELKMLIRPLGRRFIKERLVLMERFRIKNAWAMLFKVKPE